MPKIINNNSKSSDIISTALVQKKINLKLKNDLTDKKYVIDDRDKYQSDDSKEETFED